MGPRTPWLGLMVTTLLVGLGLTEDADRARGVETGVLLPVGVLVGGGLLVLAGTILEGVLPGPALVLTALGCGASIPAALWTVVVPVLLVALFVRRAWQLSDDPRRFGRRGRGEPQPGCPPSGRPPRTPRRPAAVAQVRVDLEAEQRCERTDLALDRARVDAVSGTSSCSASTRSSPASGSAVASSLPTSRSPWSTGIAQ